MAEPLADQTSGQSVANLCETDGNFAVICSFFYKFSESLGITYNIQHLKEMIEDSDHLSEELVELHIKLLRKRRKYINKDKWERALVKFCAEYSNVDSWELERYGYKNSKLSIKLEILKRLLEAQFDYNSKFKLEVNANEAQSLRLLPIGRDVNGHMYWYQLDPESNFRVYREEAEDEQSWLLVCQNKSQLESLIADLETNNTIESLNKEETSSLSDTNDDNNSNLNNRLVSIDIKLEANGMDVSEDGFSDNKVSQSVSNDNKVSEEVNVNTCDELVAKSEIKCEPNEDLNDSVDVLSDVKTLSLKLDPNEELNDNKCVENGLTEDTVSSEHELTEKSSDLLQIKCELNVELDLKANCADSAPKLTELSVKTIQSNDKQTENKSIFTENKFQLNCFVNNFTESEDQMKSDFKYNNKNNLFDSQLDCDVLCVIRDIVGKVSTDLSKSALKASHSPGAKQSAAGHTAAPVMSQMTLLSIEQTVSALCDFLVDEVCKESSDEPTVRQSGFRGRGRPPRVRGRGRGRGRSTSSVAKVNIYNKRGRSESLDGSEEREHEMTDHQPLKRCSRRIQAIQERKAQEMSEKVKQEQQKIEELAKKRCALMTKDKEMSDEDSTNSTGSRRRSKKEQIIESEDSDSDASEDKKHQRKRRRKGTKNGAKPWEDTDDSSDSVEESVEEEEEHEDEDVLNFDDNEDEFACEEPEPDAEPVVVRRARTVRKVRSDSSDSESSSESEVENDDKPCGRCGKYDHPEWILLCDKCDEGFHTACLRPPLLMIPDGDWFCPPCEHKMLCQRLQEELSTLSVQLAKREREELRKQRLKYVAISVDNILKKPTTNRRKTNGKEISDELMSNEDNTEAVDENDSNIDNRSKRRTDNEDNEGVDDEEEDDEDDDSEEAEDEIGKALWSDEEEDKYAAIKSRRNRSRKNINYKFSEYDQLIKSAIELEMDVEYDQSVLDSGPEIKSKGKDMDNIIASNAGEELDFSLTPALTTVDPICEQTIAESVVKSVDKIVESIETEVKTTSGDNKVLENTIEDKEEAEEESDVEKNEESDGEEDEEESDESESKSKTKSGGKKRRSKQKASAATRKRHRGLNDLSDTEEEDDSDEDFKGDDSATEVEDGSDDEFVDDASTQDDDEVSDASDYNYRRRRSTRSSKSSKKASKRSKGGKNAGKKGYRKDAFVVSSDDSGDSYRPSRSRGGRAAARKKVSYCEDTTETETDEEKYYKPAKNTKTKSKSKWNSESSDEEWGRKDTKDKKVKKLWSEEEDEEEEEEEDNEDNNDSNDDEEEEEVPKSGAKAPEKSTNARLVMKGKPRLSKARGLVSLKEGSDDEDSEPNVKKTKKRSKVLEDSDNEEVVDKSEEKSVAEDINTKPINDKNSETSEQFSDNCPKTVGPKSESTLKQQKADNHLSADATKVPPLVSAPNEQTILPIVSTAVPPLIPQSACVSVPNQTNHNIDEYYSLTPLDTYPISRPPPLKPTVPPAVDPYIQASSPPRLLTLESNSAYPPRHPHMDYTSGPHPMQGPKALIDPRLERPYLSHNMPPNIGHFGAHPVPQPAMRTDLRPPHPRPPPHGFGSPYYPPVPPAGAHPYYARPPQRHETPPPFPSSHIRPQTNSLVGPPVPRTSAPLTANPAMQTHPPPPPNYRTSAAPHWTQTAPNRTQIPGYNFGAHPSQAPPYYPQSPHGQPMPAHPQSPHVVPLPPHPHYPPTPYPGYGYFGPNAGVGAPNGAFMIQNLLQHRPPNSEESHQIPAPTTTATPTPTVPTTPASNTNSTSATPSGSGGQPLRPANETFTTY